MADAGVINLDNATVVEKRSPGRPRGSKNKPKTSATASAQSTLTKRRRGRPLGSKNKKTSAAATSTTDHLDVGVAHHVIPQSSTGNLFSFFALVGAQCHEQQRLPLKSGEFMDGRTRRKVSIDHGRKSWLKGHFSWLMTH
jgi:hypothetical protein